MTALLAISVLILTHQSAPGGMLVTKVVEPSAAQAAGLKVGDVVISMNGQRVPSQEAMEAIIGNRLELTDIEVVLNRQGKSSTIKVHFPSEHEAEFGLKGVPEMPEDAARKVEDAKNPSEVAALADRAASAGQTYIAGWLYLHAADMHDKDAATYVQKGLALVKTEDDPAVRTMGLMIAMSSNPNDETAMQEIVKTLEAGKFTIYEADIFSGMAALEFKANHYDLALAYFTKTKDILEPWRPKSKDLAEAYHSIGLVATMMGKFALAEDMDLKAIAIREVSMPDTVELAASYADAGLAAGQRADFRPGVLRLEKARLILEKLPDQESLLSVIYNNLGLLYQLEGDSNKAESTYRKCLSMQLKVMPESNLIGITETNLALVLFTMGRKSEAQRFAQDALKRATDQNPESPQEAAIRGILGLIEIGSKDFDKADADLTKATKLIEQFAPDSVQLAIALSNQGVLDVNRKDMPSAKSLFARAMLIADENRRSVVSPEERVHLQEATFFIPRFYARSLADEGALPDAFMAIENGRGRALEDMMAEKSVDFAVGAPTQLVIKQQAVIEALTGSKKQMADLLSSIEDAKRAKNSAEVTKLGKTLAAVRMTAQDQRERQNDLERQIRTASPRYAALKYPEPISLEVLREAVAPGDLVVAFSSMPDVTQIFTFEKGARPEIRVNTVQLPQEKLRSLVAEFRQAIINRGDSSQPGAALYHALIEPIYEQISHCKHLLLMPDAGLGQVPFCAIPVGLNKTLTDLAPINYELSVAVYRDLVKMPRAETGFVGVAFPTKESVTHPLEETNELFRSSSRRVLPDARGEVNKIAGLFPDAKIFLDEQATLANVLPSLANARYIHFACHGVMDSIAPLDSGLALCPEANKDGLLLAKDFLKLNLKADLVTLSACDSGRGVETYTEGLTGFARALHYAGARSVLTTLWPIEDESTSILMQAFYSKLKSGSPKDVALQAAIKTLKSNPKYADPKFWAPFVLSGAYN